MAFSVGASDVGVSWRDRALGRSLDPAVARSQDRIDRLFDAARKLTDESGDAGFTVVQVASAAGVSLKTFYRYFDGKDELLLALLEEESRVGAGLLAASLAKAADPGARLRRYVDGILSLAHASPGYAGVLVREHRRLSAERPDALAAALQPLLDLLEAEIEQATDAADASRAAEIVFALLLSGVAEVALAGRDRATVTASYWEFISGGLRMTASRRTKSKSNRRSAS
jgi:AcrR family transcriptional regulator